MVYFPEPHLTATWEWQGPEVCWWLAGLEIMRTIYGHLSQLHVQRLAIGGLELAKVFTPWKLANTINHGFFQVSWLLLSHDWLWGIQS